LNAAVSGQAAGAPEQPPVELTATLSALTGELAARAQEAKRPVDHDADAVAHHLAAGLRVRVSQQMLTRLDATPPGRVADATVLDSLRDPWLRLAAHEYVAVAALEAELDPPRCNEPFEHLAGAIADAAASVICGARLAGRPTAFRHRRAWRQQAVALTYALEAYVAGVRGQSSCFARAQRITLTRLVRATVAIALIDLASDRLGAAR
jgi:hypothetical protein